jgi:hypothetical protein
LQLLGLSADVLLGRAEGASASSGWAGASGLDGLVMELVRQLCQQVLGLDTLAAAYRCAGWFGKVARQDVVA